MEDNKKLSRQEIETIATLLKGHKQSGTFNEEHEEQLNQLLATISQEQHIDPQDYEWALGQLSPFLVAREDLKKMEDDFKKAVDAHYEKQKEQWKQFKAEQDDLKVQLEKLRLATMQNLKKVKQKSEEQYLLITKKQEELLENPTTKFTR